MTLAPFASVEARLNSAVQARLSNAVAVHQDGQPFGVVFERAMADGFDSGAVTGAQYSASFCAANTPELVEGGTLVISGARYRVASGVEPDAGGWVTVELLPA
ncbi:MAG: hypothetical protein EOP24_26740 [Hyphomicrobiales bacterium]|nr:MAG: hypothetical protein EOP24_26740 [Hyphomicrobiales bacterium]